MTPTPNPNPRIFLSAGEASGEHYGALLIDAIRAHIPGATFFGLGGQEMEAAGCERVVKAEDVAHMGITEVIRHMPRIYGEYRKLSASIKKVKPDVAVLIDFPDVNMRLARKLKALGVPVIYFVGPQLWAWKKWRIRWVRERVTRMMVIFPFEEPFYRARGVDAEFVGHPLAELPMPASTREHYAVQHGLDPARQWIALLPGSRMKEIKLNLPEMLQAVALLGSEYEFILPVASTLSHDAVTALLHALHRSACDPGNCPHYSLHLVDEARDALAHARASIVASGTATVQAAIIGNPFVVVYRVSNMTYRLAKHLISYPPEIHAQPDEYGNLPVAMVNLIAGSRVVPELLQEQCNGENIVVKLKPLLADGPAREQMIADLARVRMALLPPANAAQQTGTGFHAIEQVFRAVLRELGHAQD